MSAENRSNLRAAKAGMSTDESRAFDSYLIGALSTKVSITEMQECINSALRCLEGERERREARAS